MPQEANSKKEEMEIELSKEKDNSSFILVNKHNDRYQALFPTSGDSSIRKSFRAQKIIQKKTF